MSRNLSAKQQAGRLGPQFNRLRNLLGQERPDVALRRDPAGLAPERLLVFEVTGSVADFHKAAARIDGLTFAAEELIDGDEEDDNPQLYLLVPDLGALRQILSLWTLWQGGQALPRGFAPWRHIFEKLRDLRVWGPADRVIGADRSLLASAADAAGADGVVRLEIELIFRPGPIAGEVAAAATREAVQNAGGAVVRDSRYPEFGYHGMLVDVPSVEVHRIAMLSQESLAGLDTIFAITPQSTSSVVEVDDYVAAEPVDGVGMDAPVVAIFDAVPVQAHPWLAPWLTVVDPDGLDALAVGPRVHGTAMASLVIHGDRSEASTTISRRVYFRAVMYAPMPGFAGERERFPDDRLIVDTMVEAVRTMRADGGEAVVVVNVSLGDASRRFSDRPSAWARALDYLSYEYGVLFVVSSGNAPGRIELATLQTAEDFENASAETKRAAVFAALDAVKADRRILSPAESINALTVGAWHSDSLAPVALPDHRHFPFDGVEMPNISSSLGHGHRRSVKPDVLYPGGREHVILHPTDAPPTVRPNGVGTRLGGVRVAAPPQAGQPLDTSAFTIGSSAATALATHAAHRIHDELEREYGVAFSELPVVSKAVLLKALLAHPASWLGSDDFIISSKFPPPQPQWDTMRREASRYLGYGFVNPAAAVSCADDRATLWATGGLLSEAAMNYSVPIPSAFSQTDRVRSVVATLAWFSATRPGRQLYRASKLRVLPLGREARAAVGVGTTVEPPWQQTENGTLIHRRWSGGAFGHLGDAASISVQVQREKDQGGSNDEAVPFALVMTVVMDDTPGIYDEVLARVAIKPQSRIQA